MKQVINNLNVNKSIMIVMFVMLWLIPGIALSQVKDHCGCFITDANTIGLWHFDDPLDPGYDSSGHGHHGIVYGTAFATGICGGALKFDGAGSVNDYVKIPFHADFLSEQMTFEALVYITDDIASPSQLIIDMYGDAGGPGRQLALETGLFPYGLCDTPGADPHYECISPDAVPIGEWVNLALVFDVAG